MPADINETDVCFCGSESLSRVQWLLLALLPHIEPSLQLLSSGCLGFLLQSWSVMQNSPAVLLPHRSDLGIPRLLILKVKGSA